VIRWEKTQLDYTLEKGPSAGRLEKVSGELYREGKLASRFTADAGYADDAKHELKLEGAVHVVSEQTEKKDKMTATLTCDRMIWRTDELLAKAYGGVKIVFKSEEKDKTGGTIGPMDELWCLPDLEKVGTPGFDWAPDISKAQEIARKREHKKP